MEIALIVSQSLAFGFLSGFHCIGMCGPIAMSMGLTKNKQTNYYIQNIVYQFGRITTYSFFGFLFGFLGEGLQLVGLQKYLTIFSGVLLIIMALFSFGGKDFASKISFLSRGLIKVKMFLAAFLRRSDYKSRYLTGVLNGFLPCGVVYAALTASLAYGGIWQGVLSMAMFGLGTFPFMFAVVLTGNVFTTTLRIKIFKIFPVLMIVLGGLFIIRGMELGIPYLSPKPGAIGINKSKHHKPSPNSDTMNNGKDDKHSCCH